MRIAIVGAGFAGLASAKVLRELGHDVTVHDRTPDVGGVWSRTRRYPGLKTQNNKQTYRFSDHPITEDHRTDTLAAAKDSRSRRAKIAASGRSPCTQIVSARTAIVAPSRVTTSPRVAIASACATAASTSSMTAPASRRGVSDPSD